MRAYPQGAAGDAVLVVPAVAVCVAVGVAGGGAQEGHIDVQVARGDGSGPPTMGTKYHREIHQAPGNLLCQGATQARGLNVCDQSGADVPNQGLWTAASEEAAKVRFRNPMAAS